MACCAAWQESPYWNIVLLALAWALTLSTSTLLTTVGPLSATELDMSSSLAAFTIGVFLIGAAVSSVPSGWLFRRFGRFWGFALGCFFQLLGSLLGALALLLRQAGWLYLGCFSIGLAQGLGQFYRFSAVEVTPAYLKSRAVTYVLSGGIIAAFLGPTSANYSINLFEKDYLGSYLLVAAFAGLNMVVLMLVNFPQPPTQAAESKQDYDRIHTSEQAGNPVHRGSLEEIPEDAEEVDFRSRTSSVRVRSAREIAAQPMFILSCAIATLAHTIMVMVMSNVSLAMEDDGYSFGKSSLVMELHFFAMFAPGFLTGHLIEKHGSLMIAFVGGFLFAGSSVVLAVDTQMWNYVLGMILLGVAWNLSFSAGTVMLTSCYEPREATEVQALNDFVLFTVAGGGSLLSGFIYSLSGWLMLIYVSSGLMVLYLLMFVYAWGGKETDDGLDAPLVLDDESRRRDESVNTVSTVRVTRVDNSIMRGVSFSSRRDGREESVDYMTPVRTLSVT